MKARFLGVMFEVNDNMVNENDRIAQFLLRCVLVQVMLIAHHDIGPHGILFIHVLHEFN